MSDLIIKATHGAETRRFRVARASATYAEISRNLQEMFAELKAELKFAYVDADGDLVTFSSENELADALAQRADNSAPFKILVSTANNNGVVIANDDNNNNNNAGSNNKIANIWLELPIWVRHRIMTHNNLVGDVNDASLFDKLNPAAKERVHARFVAKCAKKQSAALHVPSIVAVPIADAADQQHAAPLELSDEEFWAAVPIWLKHRVVAKFVPHLAPQATEFASFVALPEHVKVSVRNRAARVINKRDKHENKLAYKQAKKFASAAAAAAAVGGPHPPATPPPAATVADASDEAKDRALWEALPPWVQLKVAARAAHSGHVTENPRDFATFKMLPPHVQAKMRANVARGKWQHSKW